MSTGLECEFIKPDGYDQWFYILQDWDCPVGAWDWREYATAYGPFPSYERAHEHLRLNHANPGGHSISEDEAIDAVLADLISKAKLRRWPI